MICTSAELEWLERQAPEERSLLATLIFSAKEAFYKCQFSLTHGWLGFRDVELKFEADTFAVRLIDPGKTPALENRLFQGRFATDEGHVYTAIGIE